MLQEYARLVRVALLWNNPRNE